MTRSWFRLVIRVLVPVAGLLLAGFLIALSARDVDWNLLSETLIGIEPATAALALMSLLATIRRLECDAGIIPVVLATNGEVLDIGRRTRTTSTALRNALTIRDRGCTFPGCTQPPSWCDARHVRHWSGRPQRPRQPRPVVLDAPPRGPRRQLADHQSPRRPPRVQITH